MAFSIESLLKKQESANEFESEIPNSAFEMGRTTEIRNIGLTDSVITDNRSAPMAFMQPPMASAIVNQQLPTLADLQLLFGGGGPKAHYRRNRRSGADRKPRQAYSSKQLEKLEDEFKRDKYLSVSKRVELSKSLNLSETQIKTWFQNRRTKWKKQVTASLRQLYRHGLYSQYAAAAATSNPPCFLPMMASNSGFYETINAPALNQQPGTSAAITASPWNASGNLILGFPNVANGQLDLAFSQEAKEAIAGRSTSSASTSSEASNSILPN